LGRLWATNHAQQGGKVLYGETRWGRYWLTWVDPAGWTQREVNLEQFFHTLTTESDNPASVVILDGAAETSPRMQDLAFSLMENQKIVISTRQLILKNVGIPHVQLPAWTLDEMLSASEEKTFYDQTVLFREEKFEDREKFITTKFSLTGGAPQLMFEKVSNEAQNMLRVALSSLSIEGKKAVLFGALKPSHDRSQHALVHYFVNPAIKKKSERYGKLIKMFSSQFVLRQLQSALDFGDVRKLRAQCQALNRVMEVPRN